MHPSTTKTIAPTVVFGAGIFGTAVIDSLTAEVERVEPEPVRLGAYRWLHARSRPQNPAGWVRRIADATEHAASRELMNTGYRLIGEGARDPGRPVHVYFVCRLSGEDSDFWTGQFFHDLVSELARRVSVQALGGCHIIPLLAFRDRTEARPELQAVNSTLHEVRDALYGKAFVFDHYTERGAALEPDQVAEAVSLFLEAVTLGDIYGLHSQARPETLGRVLAGEDVTVDRPDDATHWCGVGVRCIAFPTRQVVETLILRAMNDFVRSTLLRRPDDPLPSGGLLDPRDEDFINQLPRFLQQVVPSGEAASPHRGAGRARRPADRVARTAPPIPPAPRLKDFVAGPAGLSRCLKDWLGAWSGYFRTAREAVRASLKERADHWRRQPTARRALVQATEDHLHDILRQEDYSLAQGYRRLRNLAERLGREDPGRRSGASPVVIPTPQSYEEKLTSSAQRCRPYVRRCPSPGVMLLFSVPLGLVGGSSLLYLAAEAIPSLVNSPLGYLVSVTASAVVIALILGVWFFLKHGAVYRLALELHRELRQEAYRLIQARDDGLKSLQRRELTRQLRLVRDRVERARDALKEHLRYLESLSEKTRVEDLALTARPSEAGSRLLTRHLSDRETNEGIYREQVPGGTVVAERAGLLGRPEYDGATIGRLLNGSPTDFFRYVQAKVSRLFTRVGQRDFFREKYWDRVQEEVAGLWERMTIFLRPIAPDAVRLFEGTVYAIVAHPSYLRDLLDLRPVPKEDCTGVGLPCFNRIYLLAVRYGIPFRVLAADSNGIEDRQPAALPRSNGEDPGRAEYSLSQTAADT